MENPWFNLPLSKPFILDSDKEALNHFQATAKEEIKLKTHLLPIPFIGNPLAPILFLNLNPGYHEKDDEYQITSKFETVSRNCLTHVQNEFPFYFLDSALESQNGGPGYNWWAKRTLSKLLIEFDPKFLSQKLFCVEYFPYRSVKFRHASKVLSSQYYGFDLVRLAMQREAQIILMRAKRYWFQAVPSLENYQNLITIKNPRMSAISERNLSPGGFQKIVRAIRNS